MKPFKFPTNARVNLPKKRSVLFQSSQMLGTEGKKKKKEFLIEISACENMYGGLRSLALIGGGLAHLFCRKVYFTAINRKHHSELHVIELH